MPQKASTRRSHNVCRERRLGGNVMLVLSKSSFCRIIPMNPLQKKNLLELTSHHNTKNVLLENIAWVEPSWRTSLTLKEICLLNCMWWSMFQWLNWSSFVPQALLFSEAGIYCILVSLAWFIFVCWKKIVSYWLYG